MSTQETFSVRLTRDNVETELRAGDVFTDDPEFGKVRSVRVDRTGRPVAYVTTDRERDALGLPQTVQITRIVHS